MLTPAISHVTFFDVLVSFGFPVGLFCLYISAVTNRSERRPNRVRQAAGALLFGFLCYVLSAGPFAYAAGRGWVPKPLFEAGLVVYASGPIALNRGLLGSQGHPLGDGWYWWQVQCLSLGHRHARQR